MNANAKAWVAALRSGKYKQGRDFLSNNGHHCCLGVACQLAVKAAMCRVKKKVGTNELWYGRQRFSLPPAVRRWLGLRDAAALYYDKNGLRRSLVGANDAGMPFSEIADLIESEPEGLFVKEKSK